MCEEGGCFRTFAKIILIITNILFLLAGILMLAFGIALVVAPRQMVSFMLEKVLADVFSNSPDGVFTELIKGVGIFMIILGGVVIVISFLGFFGACCESKCLLITYAIILIIIILAEIALIIFAAVYPNQFQTSTGDLLQNLLRNPKFKDVKANASGVLIDEGLNSDSKFWLYFQLGFKCCGVHNYTDYEMLDTWQQFNCDGPNCNTDYKVPISCCKRADENKLPTMTSDFSDHEKCLETPSNGVYTYKQGCIDKIFAEGGDLIRQYSKIAIGIAAGIVGLEIILIVFAFIMCCIGNHSNKYV